jgi:hypothetical protein
VCGVSAVRQDALTPLRLYCRGYNDGFATATIDETGAELSEGLLLARLHHFRFPGATVEMLLDEAYHYVTLMSPIALDPYSVRWRAAVMLLELLPECEP